MVFIAKKNRVEKIESALSPDKDMGNPPLFHEIGQRDLGPGMADVIRAKNLARRRRENFALFKGFSGRKR